MKCCVLFYGVILMMNEERYAYGYEVPLNVPTQSVPVITDTLNEKHYYSLRQVVKLLNEQQSIIHKDEISIKTMMSNMEKLEKKNERLRKYNKQLKERLEKINGGYGHLTHRNGLTANEWLIESQERELKKKNEEISDWIERHSKDIAKICKQQTTIKELRQENDEWKEENRKLLDKIQEFERIPKSIREQWVE